MTSSWKNNFKEKPLDPAMAKYVGAATTASSYVRGIFARALVGEMALVGLGIAATPWAMLVVVPLSCCCTVAVEFAGYLVHVEKSF